MLVYKWDSEESRLTYVNLYPSIFKYTLTILLSLFGLQKCNIINNNMARKYRLK